MHLVIKYLLLIPLVSKTVRLENMHYPKNIGGNYNTGMGTQALRENTSGSGNTGFGQQALSTNSTGSQQYGHR